MRGPYLARVLAEMLPVTGAVRADVPFVESVVRVFALLEWRGRRKEGMRTKPTVGLFLRLLRKVQRDGQPRKKTFKGAQKEKTVK
jgi:hypothetical protein